MSIRRFAACERAGLMLFDTDVLIWYMRGNTKAAAIIEEFPAKSISVITYMELLQGVRNKDEIKLVRDFLKDLDFVVIPLTENIGHRASVYMEQYCLKADMCLSDALIAATAVENNLPVCTGNSRHYKPIGELQIKTFRNR